MLLEEDETRKFCLNIPTPSDISVLQECSWPHLARIVNFLKKEPILEKLIVGSSNATFSLFSGVKCQIISVQHLRLAEHFISASPSGEMPC